MFRRCFGVHVPSFILGVIVAICLVPLWVSFLYSDDELVAVDIVKTNRDAFDRTLVGTAATLVAKQLFRRYHEMPEMQFVDGMAPNRWDDTTSFQQATVVRQSPPWFIPPDHLNVSRQQRTLCAATCCATPFAISLSQDDRRIISTTDGPDLADVLLRHYATKYPQNYFATVLTPDLVPCLQPGVIIHVDNHRKDTSYFFTHIANQISVPYVLVTSRSDASSPELDNQELERNKIIKWYGQSVKLENINVSTRASTQEREHELRRVRDKFVSFPLGISVKHNQLRYLRRYLELRNYSNPFRGREQKQLWTDWATSLARKDKSVDALTEVRNVLFVKYGINKMSHKARKTLFELLCETRSSGNESDYTPLDQVSCSQTKRTPHEIYNAASKYLFGLSPPGSGWDCYRTYELLLLGIIPVVFDRPQGTHDLFDGLPVLLLPSATNFSALRATDFLRLMREYVTSRAFQENDFDGWERLFFKFWRRRLLSDGGRQEVLTDQHGAEYYTAWQYTRRTPEVLCSEGDNCLGVS